MTKIELTNCFGMYIKGFFFFNSYIGTSNVCSMYLYGFPPKVPIFSKIECDEMVTFSVLQNLASHIGTK